MAAGPPPPPPPPPPLPSSEATRGLLSQLAVAQAPGAAGLSASSRAQAALLVEGAWRREDARAAAAAALGARPSTATPSTASSPLFSPRDPAVQRESAAARAVDVAARLEAALPGCNVPFRLRVEGTKHAAPAGHPHHGVGHVERQGWWDFPEGVTLGPPGDAMAGTRAAWDARVVAELRRMHTELGIPLAEATTSTPLRGTDAEALLPEFGSQPEGWMPLWDATNVVEALASAKRSRSKRASSWRLCCVRTAHAELRREVGRWSGWDGAGDLADALRTGLGAGVRQTGVDDVLHEWFRDARGAQGAQVAARCYPPACRLFSRRGCPPGVRPLVWKGALGLTSGGAGEVRGEVRGLAPERRWEAAGAGRQSTVRDRQDAYFRALARQATRGRLLVDHLAALDCATSVRCHEDYFVYEPVCRAALACLSRDGWVRERCRARIHPDVRLDVAVADLVLAPDGARPTTDALPAYPPSGVVPFRGLALLAAPLCYLYDDPADVYFAFRALYVRHFCFLGCLDAADGRAAPALGRLFEDLLAEREPIVFQHLSAIGAPPLAVAFPWIHSAFSGVLAVDQILLLWDRVIGFDSLVPLVLLAVALFGFKRDQLLACADPADVAGVFGRSLRGVRVVPLLQATVDALLPAAAT